MMCDCPQCSKNTPINKTRLLIGIALYFVIGVIFMNIYELLIWRKLNNAYGFGCDYHNLGMLSVCHGIFCINELIMELFMYGTIIWPLLALHEAIRAILILIGFILGLLYAAWGLLAVVLIIGIIYFAYKKAINAISRRN